MLIKSKDNPLYQHKYQKLDAKAHIGFFVGYESNNIYQIWIPIKKKVVSVRDIIFCKDIVWDRKPIAYSDNDIKGLDEAIIHIEIPESEAKKMEDIQLIKDVEVHEPIPTITRQADHKDENLDKNHKKSKQQFKDKYD